MVRGEEESCRKNPLPRPRVTATWSLFRLGSEPSVPGLRPRWGGGCFIVLLPLEWAPRWLVIILGSPSLLLLRVVPLENQLLRAELCLTLLREAEQLEVWVRLIQARAESHLEVGLLRGPELQL